MKAGSHSMPEVYPKASSTPHLVQIEVSSTHPLLLLKQALPWEAITEAMTRHWREHGKNVDGGPGLPWDVSLLRIDTLRDEDIISHRLVRFCRPVPQAMSNTRAPANLSVNPAERSSRSRSKRRSKPA
jgi:hypothetical protein